jgi:spore maturation protein CgeB
VPLQFCSLLRNIKFRRLYKRHLTFNIRSYQIDFMFFNSQYPWRNRKENRRIGFSVLRNCEQWWTSIWYKHHNDFCSTAAIRNFTNTESFLFQVVWWINREYSGDILCWQIYKSYDLKLKTTKYAVNMWRNIQACTWCIYTFSANVTKLIPLPPKKEGTKGIKCRS